jgi:hypothetical protein
MAEMSPVAAPTIYDPDVVAEFGACAVSLLVHGVATSVPRLQGQDLRPLAEYWVKTNLRIELVERGMSPEVRDRLLSLGLAPAFLDALQIDYNAVGEACAALSHDIPFASDRSLSQRVRDVAGAVLLGGKPILSPFTGQREIVRDTIGPHIFVHRHDGDACVIIPDWRIAHVASDRCWFFPKHNLIVAATTGIDPERQLIETLPRLVANRAGFERYFAQPERKIMISEEYCPHIGHNIWNVISGWQRLFALVPLDKIDIITSYNWTMFGGVTALHAEQMAGVGKVLRPITEQDRYDYILSENACSLMLYDNFVTSQTARRVAAWSHGQASADFRTAAESLRAASDPLLMVTLRTGNRAWVEQEAGLANIITALATQFPRIGIIIDGLNSGLEVSHVQMTISEELELAKHLIASCPGVRIFNSVGCSPAESIVLTEMIDAFLAPIGAGMAKYRWISNKTGVGYSNTIFLSPGDLAGHLYDSYRDDPVPMVYVDPADVSDVDEGHRGDRSRANFSMDWQVPLRLVADLLENLYRPR